MKTIGKLRNLSGDFSASEAVLYQDQKTYILRSESLFGFFSFEINLNEQLASCSIDNHKKTSTPDLFLKMGLGGLAGHTWMKGYGGTAGMLAGAASSVNTDKSVAFIRLNFINGQHLEAETDGRTASVISNISPQLSGKDVQNIHLRQQKLQRYLDDAPRTYYEVSAEVKALEQEIARLTDVKDNASSFDERESALEKYNSLKSQLEDKSSLRDELSIRARAIKKYGDWEKFDKETTNLFLKIVNLEEKIEFRGFKFLFALAALCGILIAPSIADETKSEWVSLISFIYLLFYIPYFLHYSFMKGFRKKKIRKLHVQYDEYNLENVQL